MAGFDERKQGSHMKVLSAVGKNKAVLEVGCGQGFVSERLKQNGCRVTAIELDGEAAGKANKFCEKVVVGNIETMNLGFGKESFDVVLFGDVLEHLHEPAAVLEKVKPFLKKDGRIVVSLPNIANWKVRLKLLFGKFDYEEQGIMDKTHLKFFNRKNARQMIEEAGYEIERSDFVPSFPFPFFKAQLARINPNAFAFQFVFTARKK